MRLGLEELDTRWGGGGYGREGRKVRKVAERGWKEVGGGY